MRERLWSYPEIKFIRVNIHRPNEELAEEVNSKFHDGESMRGPVDIAKIKYKRNILDY